MENRGWKLSLGFFFASCCTCSLLLALSGGPPTAVTGDFGEGNCTECHFGNNLNTPGGTLAISGVPAEYQPGQTYPITVSIQKSGQSRWGFELAVRVVSTGAQAGTLATTDGNTQIVTVGGIQYIMHTSAGTFPRTNSGTWSFKWTAPATAQGQIRFSAAGNAANNNNTNSGDFIYTTTASSKAATALATSALFAHIAVGGGYTTTFTFLNVGNSPVTGSLILTGQDGAPLNATLAEPAFPGEAPGAGPVLASTSSLSIPAGGAQIITASAANPGEATRAGWARVESSGGTLIGVASFRYISDNKLQTTVGVLSAESVESATIPVLDDAAANVSTGYAIANPSTADTITVKVVMVKEDGTVAATLSPITLVPGQQKARFFSEDPAASKTFRGTAVLIGPGGKGFLVVALIQNQGLFSAIPVTAGKAPHIN